MTWTCAVLFACLALRPDARRINRAADHSATGRCDPAPAPPAAVEEEVAAALQNLVDSDALSRALQQDTDTLAGMDLGEGTADLPPPSEAFNPHGFCPLHTKEERAEAAQTAGGGPLRLFQTFDEFNTGLLTLTGMPINPATDHTLLERGPVQIDNELFEQLNNVLPTWDDIRTAGFLTMALPAFILTDGRNRTTFFMNKAISACWNPDMLALGPMAFTFNEVSAGVSDPNQRRGYYTATVPQHRDFFHPETILFLDGDRHLKYRQLLELSGFARRYPVDIEVARQIPVAEGCEVPEKEVFATHVGRLVQISMWGSDPPEEIMDDLRTYSGTGALGIFGAIIQPVLDLAGKAGEVRQARDNVAKYVGTSPFGEVFFKARDHLLPEHPWFLADDVLLSSIGVASLFAGLVGTMDITEKCVKFQKLETRHQELFRQDPEKYLIELMRFDSAVTSTTELLQEDTQIVLEGRNVTLKAGSPRQLILATANRDPSFWHNPSDFDPERSQLAETLSWNGRAEDVEARSLEKAPRHCPGMCLSLKVASAVCASMTGVFDELLEAGKILANNGVVKCNNFGEHDEPELWTPPEEPLPEAETFPPSGEAALVRQNVECRSPSLDMGSQPTLTQCAEAVKAAGGKFFIYGHGWLKQGKCYIEYTNSAECAEGFRANSYDFFDIPTISVQNTIRGHANVVEVTIGGPEPSNAFWEPAVEAETFDAGMFDREQVAEKVDVASVIRVIPGGIFSQARTCSQKFRLAVWASGTDVETFESCCQGDSCEIPADEQINVTAETLQKGTPWTLCRQESDKEFTVTQESFPTLQQVSVGNCLRLNLASETISLQEVLNRCPAGLTQALQGATEGLMAWWNSHVQAQLDKGGDVREDQFLIEELIGKELGSSSFDPVTFDRFTVGMTLTIIHANGRRVNDTYLPASQRIPVPVQKKFLDRNTVYDFVGTPDEDPDMPDVELLSFGKTCMVSALVGMPFRDDVLDTIDAAGHDWSLILGLKEGYPSSCPNLTATCSKRDYVYGTYDAYRATDGSPVYPPLVLDFQERFLVDGAWRDEGETLLGWTLYGTHHIEVSAVQETAFVIRTNILNKLSRRPGFGEPGADMYFDAAGTPVMIETPRGFQLWRSEVDAETWQYWKFVWRSSIFLSVTLIDHLWATHFSASSALGGASREALAPTHPLRRLLSLFTFNAAKVNHAALHALIAPRGILQRSTPFSDYKQVTTVARAALPSLKTRFGMFFNDELMSALPEEVQRTPFFQDGKILFDALRKLVDDWFGVYPEWCSGGNLVDEEILMFWRRVPSWSLTTLEHFDGVDSEFLGFYGSDGSIRCDGFKLWLAIQMFHVSGYHRHVGTVADDAADPDWACFSWKVGERFGSPRQAVMTSLISSATARTWPKLSEDYTFIAEGIDRAEEVKDVLRDFNSEMQSVKEIVEARNAERAVPYLQMHPDQVEISVAV